MKKVHIGIDLDNTIVIYDEVFYKYGQQRGLISASVKKNKPAIRTAIQLLPGGEDKWTKFQGLVYGQYMEEAELADGFAEFLRICNFLSMKVSIVSHRTIYPARGARINLREAARKWIEKMKIFSQYGIADNNVVFTNTLEGKFDQIKKRSCTHFIDDLPQVLLHPNFPDNVKKILYATNTKKSQQFMCFKNWQNIKDYFEKSAF